MDAVKYIKEFNRMVQLRENGYCKILCNNCPISKAMDEINGKYDGCTGFMRLYPEKAVEIVEQWAKDHPRKTSEDRICPLLQCKCIKEKCEFYIESGCVAEHIFNLAVTMAKMG